MRNLRIISIQMCGSSIANSAAESWRPRVPRGPLEHWAIAGPLWKPGCNRGGESFGAWLDVDAEPEDLCTAGDTRKTHTLILDDNDDGDAVANMLRGGAGADGGRRKAASRGHCLSEGLGYDMHVYRQQVRVPRSLGARARSRPFAPSSLPLAFRRSFV